MPFLGIPDIIAGFKWWRRLMEGVKQILDHCRDLFIKKFTKCIQKRSQSNVIRPFSYIKRKKGRTSTLAASPDTKPLRGHFRPQIQYRRSQAHEPTTLSFRTLPRKTSTSLNPYNRTRARTLSLQKRRSALGRPSLSYSSVSWSMQGHSYTPHTHTHNGDKIVRICSAVVVKIERTRPSHDLPFFCAV